MIQINDEYYEDLTPQSVTELLKALKESASTSASPSSVKMPGSGPLSGRQTCENSKGQTNLLQEPWGTEKTRADL